MALPVVHPFYYYTNIPEYAMGISIFFLFRALINKAIINTKMVNFTDLTGLIRILR